MPTRGPTCIAALISFMRTTTIFTFALTVSGCAAMRGPANHGVTRSELKGTASVVFTNATPEPICNMQIQHDGAPVFGDNWLPSELPSGKSVDLQVKPGTYMATWNTCKREGRPYHAGTLVSQNAFTLKDGKDAVQLFAYVADTVAPTKRAAPRDFHTMIKFPGQICDGVIAGVDSLSQPPRNDAIKSKPVATAERNDMSAFIDQKAAKTPRKTPMKASLVRKHDVGDGRVGFTERKR